MYIQFVLSYFVCVGGGKFGWNSTNGCEMSAMLWALSTIDAFSAGLESSPLHGAIQIKHSNSVFNYPTNKNHLKWTQFSNIVGTQPNKILTKKEKAKKKKINTRTECIDLILIYSSFINLYFYDFVGFVINSTSFCFLPLSGCLPFDRCIIHIPIYSIFFS